MADEEDYSSLPLEQRLTHKVWKVRMNAYNDLKSELKQLDPESQAGQFSNYESYLSKMVLDSNMAAQESGVNAVIAFVENAPNPTRRREEIVAGIVSKCLSATKAGTRASSKELLLLLSEVDTPAPVVTGVIEGFDAKQPKSVAAAVAAVKDIVHAFGVKFINLKGLLKALSKPFSHRDNGVRTEAQHLTVELYRWMGQAILPSLQELPPVLLKELEAQFAAAAKDPPPKQERLLRSQQGAEEPTENVKASTNDGETDEVETGADDAAGAIDPWDIADPVDITQKLPEDFFPFLASKKWKERKEVVEQLHETLKKTPRLQINTGTGDVIQELGKKIADTNIIVATLAIQSLGRLAAALRQAFGPYIQSTLPALVEKSKERKQTVVDAIRETEDAYFMASGKDLSAIGDHYFTGATHKNPQTRAEAHRLLQRCFAVVPTRPGKGDVKRYADQLKVGLDDGDAGVREAAAECLGTLSKLVTAKVLEPFIEGVDNIKKGKINEYAEKATVEAKAAPKPKATVTARAPSGRPQPRPRAPLTGASANGTGARKPVVGIEDTEAAGLGANLPPHIRKKLEASARAAAIKKAEREGRPLEDVAPAASVPPPPQPKAAAPRRAAPTASLGATRRPAPALAAKGTKAAKAGSAGQSGSKVVRMRFSNDETLDGKIESALPAAVLSGLESSAWKERVEAMDQLREFLGDEAGRGAGVDPELVVRQMARRPGWKESNFQVTSRSFQIIQWMAQSEEVDFGTGAAALCVAPLVDKLGDIKLKGAAGAALEAMAEKHSLGFLIELALEPIRTQKSPKVVTDCLGWVDRQLVEFGLRGLPLRAIIEMVRDAGLTSSSAQARARAVGVMGTLRRGVGPSISDLVGDLNPQLLQVLDAEFERVGAQALPEPTRTQRGSQGATGGQLVPEGGSGGSEDTADELFPRQDLQTLIGTGLYRQLGDANWKERKAGLETIQGALDATHMRIQNVPGEMYAALKQRLQDPNKNLVAVALGLLGALSTASNTAPAAHVRVVALATMQCLADKKPQVRTAALAALDAWAAANPQSVDQAILPAVPVALGDTSPELRSALLRWTGDTLAARQAGGRLPELWTLVSPLFTCLQDRNVEVRKQAQRVLGFTVASCGFEAVHDACAQQLRGAAHGTVAPIVEEYRNSIAADSGKARRPGAAAAAAATQGRVTGVAERAASPAEAVMTASELLGRTTVGGSGAGAARAASSGAGMLRRPMAVRRGGGGSGVVSRAGSSLGGGVGRLSEEELARLPPLLDGDVRAKEQRARREGAAGAGRWAQLGDHAVRAEAEEQLREQCAGHMNPQLQRQLFSRGHYRDRDYLAGLTAVDEALGMAGAAQQRFGLPLTAAAGVDSLAGRAVAHMDLLLKYIAMRMYDGSTHTLLKSVDVLERLMQLAGTAGWTDYEAQAVVPALVSRLGDAKEAVRGRARRLVTQHVPQLWTATKVVTALLEHGVANRGNARVRQESLDCVGVLVREHGVQAGAARVVAQTAHAVGDRDGSVRAAALNVLVTVGELLPGGADELWRLCGPLAERERAMLEEKLKRSSLAAAAPSRPASRIAAGRPRPAPPASGITRPASGLGLREPHVARPGSGLGLRASSNGGTAATRFARQLPASSALPPPAAPTGARPMFSLDFDKLNLPAYSSATAEQLGGAGRGGYMRSVLAASNAAVGASDGVRPAGSPRVADFATLGNAARTQWMTKAVAEVGGGDANAAEAAIERLQALLSTADRTVDDASPVLTHMRSHIPAICAAGTAQLHRAYTGPGARTSAPLGRLRKAIVSLLLDVFADPRLALWAPPRAVNALLDQLVHRLADPQLSTRHQPTVATALLPDADQLAKAINTLVVRILDRADRTAVYMALMRELDAAVAEPIPNPPQSDADVLRGAVADIVMKCLWRISKDLATELSSQATGGLVQRPRGDPSRNRFVDPAPVLQTAELFFVHTPGDKWRAREDKRQFMFGDLPKRTVKTIAHSLALALGPSVWPLCTRTVRYIMRMRPALLSPPPRAESASQLLAWAQETHEHLLQVSEIWTYLSRSLLSGGKPAQPSPEQMLALYRAAQVDAEEEEDGDASAVPPRSPALSQSSPLLAHSPLLARSPVLSQASPLLPAVSSPAQSLATSSNADRLLALRERIGGSIPPAVSTTVPAEPPKSDENAGTASAPMSSSADKPPETLSELRQRIALMRKSLSKNK
ncbi:ARM repeat-containing protein [Coemansia reversa NRRL 1564]|uniref:ARM repeat-containing protein n=1 Tax=Coemansia reversa (strain ATCC 12441 / NRRL 1564) TaxID=763665 RepID=A0A2G5BJE2_COERN|nr:ARM repeat-containing protein [Coemansia reversa NRRL 1564]|eukprot:PIA19092.1 ARM repeat-containing protein [Coemansia reversa NRRL 1564]